MNAASPRQAAVPAGSRIATRTAGAHFHDAWVVRAGEPDRSALGQFIKAFGRTPRWVDACMRLRNRVVRLAGLKDLGAMAAIDPARPEGDYRPGDRLGIFTLYEIGNDEVLLGDRDRHLDVVLSLHCARGDRGETLVTVTTVVHVHNLLGRLYMLPVAPMHRVIAPAVLRTVSQPG